MDLYLWLTFVAASAALLLVPGPTILLVLSYALSRGRSVAIATALGVACGDFIAMTASLLGLGALVLASATLFSVLKWAGAVYLIWLGIQMLRAAPHSQLGQLPESTTRSDAQIFGHAAAVTALNPKSIAFFIAFVPRFLDSTTPLMPQFSILIATFVGLATLNALAYALLGARMREGIRRPAVLRGLTRLGGGTLIGMGLLTASLSRAPS